MPTKPTGKQPKNCYICSKSPYWQYDVVIAGERQRGSTGRTSAKEAAAFVESLKAAMRERQSSKGKGSTKAKQPVTVETACEKYGEQKKDGTTQYQLAWLIIMLCADDAERLVSDVTTADFKRYAIARRAMTNSRGTLNRGSTINREIELARRVWRFVATLNCDIGDEPEWTKVIESDDEIARVRELTADEEDRLFPALKQISPDLLILAEFAMLSGQRKAALINLKWTDVNFRAGLATITLKGKGEKKRQHAFPLTTRMVELLRSRPQVCRVVFTYECARNAPKRTDRPARIAGQRFPFTVGGWSRQWRAALIKAEVEDFVWHDLRHTAASRLLREVNNLEAVRQLLGHTTIEQTSRYAHVHKNDLRKLMEVSQASSQSPAADAVSLKMAA